MSTGSWVGLFMLVAIFLLACGWIARLAYVVFRAIKPARPALCDECGHAAHRGECQAERGDSYSSGFAPMALGPCGCKGARR